MVDSLERWVAECKANMLADVQTRAKRSAETLIQNTPVGVKTPSGRRRNSWAAAIGEPPTGTDPGRGGHDVSGGTALAQIDGVIDQLELGQTLYIASDAPGMRVTEEGDRNTPPSRMVLAAASQWAD